MRNQILLEASQKIITNASPSAFMIDVRFISASPGSKFSYYLLDVDEILITRDYADNFADEIDLKATISPKDYALLQDQGQNLKCVLSITYVKENGTMLFDPPPLKLQYNVMLNASRDIRTAVPDVDAYTEPQVELSVRLVEAQIYNIRTTKINVPYQTMTVEQAIYAITQFLGVEKLHLVPPDNTHRFDQIPIGSFQGIDSIYGYLQSTCGVYWAGLNNYYTEGVLYVYPAFRTDPEYDKSIIFYQVDTGRYAGVNAYHQVKGNNVSVVINTQPQSTDLSIAGAENVGTGFIFNRASRMSDGITAVDSQEGAKFTDTPSLSFSLENPRSLDPNNNNIVQVHGTDNPYQKMSDILAHQASLMDVIWQRANPFLVDPCQKVVYYYDQEGVMMKKTGMIDKALYVIKGMQRMGTKTMFGCTGRLLLRLSPNSARTL